MKGLAGLIDGLSPGDGDKHELLAKSDGGTSESKGEASEEHKFLSERKNWFGCADKMKQG